MYLTINIEKERKRQCGTSIDKQIKYFEYNLNFKYVL